MKRLAIFFAVPAALVIGAVGYAAHISSSDSTPATVSVRSPTPKPTVEPKTVPEAIVLVRQQGSAEFATWSDKAIENQFDQTCELLQDDWSFAYVVYSLTSRDIAPLNAHDAGTVVAGAVLSKCTNYISNL